MPWFFEFTIGESEVIRFRTNDKRQLYRTRTPHLLSPWTGNRVANILGIHDRLVRLEYSCSAQRLITSTPTSKLLVAPLRRPDH